MGPFDKRGGDGRPSSSSSGTDGPFFFSFFLFLFLLLLPPPPFQSAFAALDRCPMVNRNRADGRARAASTEPVYCSAVIIQLRAFYVDIYISTTYAPFSASTFSDVRLRAA